MNALKWLFYRLIYRILQLLLLIFKPFLPPKLHEFVSDRQTLITKKTLYLGPQQNPIWFHFSSGEIEYIKPLLRKIKLEYPDEKIFLTYFSPSGKPMAERAVKMFEEANGYSPLPWDDYDSILFFLGQLKPKMLIISRTDLWPELILQCHKKKIPISLVAATFAPGSKKISFLGRFFANMCIPFIDKILVVSKDDQDSFSENFPGKNSIVAGDPRYDQVIYRMNEQKKEIPNYFNSWKDEKVWIAGSTWPEDEKIIAETLKIFPLSNKLILVPHENTKEHLKAIEVLLKKYNLPYVYSSQMLGKYDFDSQTKVLIFDQKGFLLDLYRLTDLAFLGGSFKEQVHSVMEALGNGCRVIVGPHYLNNREAIEFQQIKVGDLPIVVVANNPAEFTQHLENHFQKFKPEHKQQIIGHFNEKTKAAEKTFEELFGSLKK